LPGGDGGENLVRRRSPDRAVVNVWTGIKAGGNDPVGAYTRQSGCDPTATFTVEAQ